MDYNHIAKFYWGFFARVFPCLKLLSLHFIIKIKAVLPSHKETYKYIKSSIHDHGTYKIYMTKSKMAANIQNGYTKKVHRYSVKVQYDHH